MFMFIKYYIVYLLYIYKDTISSYLYVDIALYKL